jgi:ATP-dependent Clp protease protease subunit
MKNAHYNRTITLSGYVDSESVKEIINFINEINEYDKVLESELVNYEREAIILQLNTMGGEAYSGFALASVIELSVTPIVTLAIGSVMSVGLVIWLAGHERMMTEYAVPMYHEVAVATHHMKLQDHTDNVFHMKTIQKMYDDFILKRTTIKKEKLESIKKSKKDYFFTPQQALEWGFVVGIVKLGEEGLEVVDN